MSVVWFLAFPFVMGAILLCFRREEKISQYINLGAALVWTAMLVFWLYPDFVSTLEKTSPFPALVVWSWLPMLKSQFAIALDGLSFSLIALNVVIALSLAFYNLNKKNLGGSYSGLFWILNGASVGSLLAADALLFYVFWEFMLIPMYFLIGIWGGKKRIYAALKFFAMTMAGSLLFLIAIIALVHGAGATSLSWWDLVALDIPFDGWLSLHGLLFIGFMAAFVVKVPVWPFHTWLPDAHTEAPTGGSVILAGVLLKLGVYGMLRWCLPLFPEASVAAAPAMLALGVLGVVLGAFAAWVQKDVKRLIAYSSVSHLGFMVIGVFSLNPIAIQGAIFQNIAHGLSTGALFLLFGMVYDRLHDREMSRLGGLAIKSGAVASLFVFATMASIGLPGLPGFVGEFLVLVGTFQSAPWVSFVAVSGVLFGAVYMLRLVRQMCFGPEGPAVAGHTVRLTWSEWAAIAPFVVGMLVLGLGSALITDWSESGVAWLVGQFIK